MPDSLGTLTAAEYLTKKSFDVLPYINADLVLAKQLEELGCATVMPLGSPIGSGQGLKNIYNIKILIENAKIPVIVDAGIGTASDAVIAMELGCDGVLINSAIAKSKKPLLMARSFKNAVIAGRASYLAGRMKKNHFATASSPSDGLI